jgi:hypothetical protein
MYIKCKETKANDPVRVVARGKREKICTRSGKKKKCKEAKANDSVRVVARGGKEKI